VRGRSGGGDAEAVAGGGDERAPVSGGAVLWLTAEVREVAAARYQNGEGGSRRGGKNFDRRRWGALFKEG
jgi:hypothetical protein